MKKNLLISLEDGRVYSRNFRISFLGTILLLICFINTAKSASPTVLTYSGDKVTYSPVTVTFVTKEQDNISVYTGTGTGINTTDIAGVTGVVERLTLTNRIKIDKSGHHTEVIRFAYNLSDYGMPVSPGVASNYRLLFRDHGTSGNWSSGGSVTVNGDSVIIQISIPCDKDYDFALATTNTTLSPLPVKLTFFKGEILNNTVSLKWQTATEVNNDFFTVESSTDEKNWSQVKEVKGNGNSSIIINYITSVPLNNVITYYRLKQTDCDGKFEYAGKIVVIKPILETTKIPRVTLKAYPNPSNGEITVVNAPDSASFEVYDCFGKLVNEFDTKYINLSGYTPGNYSIRIKNDRNETAPVKVIIR